MKTPLYEASARVLLKPNDASEQLYDNGGYAGPVFNDPDRYVSGQLDIIAGEAVASDAAKSLHDADASQVRGEVSASQSGATDIVDVTGVSPDPERARDSANAVANAYIE